MPVNKSTAIIIENHVLPSTFLERDVKFECYLPPQYLNHSFLSLLLINDGQDLVTMQFEDILENLPDSNVSDQLFCVGIHCATDRKNEYGTARILDYKGRGAKAALYSRFVLEELIPYLRITYNIISFKEKCFAGFSLGGLCALDIVWNNPVEFSRVGVFSGSFWWRDKDQLDKDFNEETDRIMHRQVREGHYRPWLKFFFEVGTMDETADRNSNGVIDSIDDTVSLISELSKKGYDIDNDISYLELKDGRHDIATWAKALPVFLEWGWGRKV